MPKIKDPEQLKFIANKLKAGEPYIDISKVDLCLWLGAKRKLTAKYERKAKIIFKRLGIDSEEKLSATKVIRLIIPKQKTGVHPGLLEVAEQLKNGKKFVETDKKKVYEWLGVRSKLTKKIERNAKELFREIGITTVGKLSLKTTVKFIIYHKDKSVAKPTAKSLPPGSVGKLPSAMLPVSLLKMPFEFEDLYGKLVASGTKGYVIITSERTDLNGSKILSAEGVVTWNSLATHLYKLSKKQRISPSGVIDRELKTEVVSCTHDISTRVAEDRTLLVIMDANSKIVGAVSQQEISDDLLHKLDFYAYFMLETAEMTLRKILGKKSISSGEIQEAIYHKKSSEMEKVLREILQSKGLKTEISNEEILDAVRKRTGKKFEGIAEMDMGDYEDVFGTETIFKKLGMDGTAESAKQAIRNIRLPRNRLMHFNREEGFNYRAALHSALRSLRELAKTHKVTP